jgi:hypothetical protein
VEPSPGVHGAFDGPAASLILSLAVLGLCASCAESTANRSAFEWNGEAVRTTFASSWRGSGVLQASGELNVSAEQMVSMSICDEAPVPHRNKRFGFVDVEAPRRSFVVFGISDACVFEGTGDNTNFRPDPQSRCALFIAGRSKTIRVTDAVIQFPSYWVPGRYGHHLVDRSTVQVQIGGDDLESARHAVYQFFGRAVDDVPPNLCASALNHERQAASPAP